MNFNTELETDEIILHTADPERPGEVTADPEGPGLPSGLDEAVAEWEAVTTISLNLPSTTPVSQSVRKESKALNWSAAIAHFSSHNDLLTYKRQIKPTIQYTGIVNCYNIIFGPPGLIDESIEADRDLLFAIGLWKLDNGDPIHIELLNSLYKSLVGSKYDPPRYGSHWDDIGFQGNDPATDLRGAGCLSLINLLYLTDKYRDLAKQIFSLSRHPTQNFPFCVMGINITRISLQAMRLQLLNREANKRRDIISVFCDFYCGCYLYLYTLWRDGKTISDSGHVLKDTELYCLKKVSQVLKKLETARTAGSSSDSEPAVSAFTNMDNLE